MVQDLIRIMALLMEDLEHPPGLNFAFCSVLAVSQPLSLFLLHFLGCCFLPEESAREASPARGQISQAANCTFTWVCLAWNCELQVPQLPCCHQRGTGRIGDAPRSFPFTEKGRSRNPPIYTEGRVGWIRWDRFSSSWLFIQFSFLIHQWNRSLALGIGIDSSTVLPFFHLWKRENACEQELRTTSSFFELQIENREPVGHCGS